MESSNYLNSLPQPVFSKDLSDKPVELSEEPEINQNVKDSSNNNGTSKKFAAPKPPPTEEEEKQEPKHEVNLIFKYFNT